MSLLRRLSDVLLVASLVLLVVGLASDTRTLVFAGLAALVASVALTLAKRRVVRSRRRQT